MWEVNSNQNESRQKGRRGRNRGDRSKRQDGARGGASWLYNPAVYKRRFCAHYPDVGACKRGDACAFAHSREEFRGPLFPEGEEVSNHHSDDFYMYCFKTLWCPIGVQHDWQQCIYAHNYLDVRRNPQVGYGCKACPHWDKKASTDRYDDRCPVGVRCPYAHGPKEQLYHPAYYKSISCLDARSGCPRGDACAFFHGEEEHRGVDPAESQGYRRPIPAPHMALLQPDFCSPPTVGGPEKKELPFLQAPSVDLSADLQMPHSGDAPADAPMMPMPMFVPVGSPHSHGSPQVGEGSPQMPMFVLPMGAMSPGTSAAMGAMGGWPFGAMPPWGSPVERGSPGSAQIPSMPPMFGMPSPGSMPCWPSPGSMPAMMPFFPSGLPDLNGYPQQFFGGSPMQAYSSPPFNAARSPPFGAQASPVFGAQGVANLVATPVGACAAPSMFPPQGTVMEHVDRLPRLSSPQMAQRSPQRMSLTPLQRYTQDILNADGDCFDLDVEKFARLSDTDSTELPVDTAAA